MDFQGGERTAAEEMREILCVDKEAQDRRRRGTLKFDFQRGERTAAEEMCEIFVSDKEAQANIGFC